MVDAAGVAVERVDVVYELDMHYLGQTHSVSALLPATLEQDGVRVDEEMIVAAFEAAYRRQFSRILPDIPVRIVSLRTAAIGRRPPFDLAALAPGPGLSLDAARLGKRPVWFGGGWRDATIWSRLDLPVGAMVEGPAVLEQPDATTVLDPGLAARVDTLGNLIIERIPA